MRKIFGLIGHDGVCRGLGRPHPTSPKVGGGRWALLGVCVMLMLAGCGGPKTEQSATNQPDGEPQQLSNTDPCAMQLHDLCGSLLLYYAEHGQLPKKLRDMDPSADVNPVLTLTCPVSGKPYVYDRTGLVPPDGMGRIIVYDPTPAHLGMRWAIKIQNPRPGRPLVARVIALPESFFQQQGMK